MVKQILLSITFVSVILCVYAGSTTKEGYICKATVRANGVFIQNCTNWNEGSVWSNLGVDGREFIIFATEAEYQGLLSLEAEAKKMWDEKQKFLKEEKLKIFYENIKKIKNLKRRFNPYEEFRF